MNRDKNIKNNSKNKSRSILERKHKHYDSKGSAQDQFDVFLSSVGNQQVARFFEGGQVQAKLDLSTPGDAFEQQADRIADQMVQMKSNSEALLPKIDSVQAKGNSSGDVPDSTEKGIKQLSGKGSSLSKPVREFFEPRLGVDLGNVKVHTGSNANALARSVNARAFTYQNEIVFGKGEYQPGTTEGKKLIGHELVHTVQQGGGVQREVLQREEAESNIINNIRVFADSNNLQLSMDLANNYESVNTPRPIYSDYRKAYTHAIVLAQTQLSQILNGLASKIIEINSGGISTIEFAEHEDGSTWLVVVSNENVSCIQAGHGASGNIIFFKFKLDAGCEKQAINLKLNEGNTLNSPDLSEPSTVTPQLTTTTPLATETTTTTTDSEVPASLNSSNFEDYEVKDKAEWFVLHQFTSTRASKAALENYQNNDAKVGVVHGVVDDDGVWYQVTPFGQDALGTKSDSYTSKAKAELAGKLLHIEMNYAVDESPSDALYNKVAQIYAYIYYANDRRKLIIICHREVDRGITKPTSRNDPFNFDFNKLYKILKDTYNITIVAGVDGITQERYEYDNWPEHRPHYETDDFFPLSGKPELDPDY